MSEPRRVVVTGAGGRLGRAVVRASPPGWTVAPYDRNALDLADRDAMEKVLGGQEFDVLINTAALTNVDYCEQHPAEAHKINEEGPRCLAELCERAGARMVHIGTDYVFAGDEPGLRTEHEPAQPISHYGTSKLAGERAVLCVSERHLIVRVSWVFGPDRPSFIDFILNEARTKDRAAAIGDKWSLPGYALDLAAHLFELLGVDGACGVVHLCNTGPACSWQEYGQYALDCAVQHGIPLKTRTVEFQALASMDRFVARRPIHTGLATGKFAQLTGVTPRHWHEAVGDYVRQLAAAMPSGAGE